jgi:hypothetical protein
VSCKYCNGSASKTITYADGRGEITVCDKCVVQAKRDVTDQGEGTVRIVDFDESPDQPATPPKPIISQFAGQKRAQEEAPTRQEPVLNHELSVEDNNRLSPDRKGLRLSLLYDTQHPMNVLPPELKRRIELAMTAKDTMPSMTNYSNMDAPIPMHPADRPV